MPLNRQALIRIKTLDKCFQNRRRRYTIENLIEACSDALYEYEGTEKEVSLRTLRSDIALMRSDKLGYNAPIEIYERKYYRYEDPEYSITHTPLSTQDMDVLTEVVGILKQFKGFNHFQDLSSLINKLEDKVYVERTHLQPIIDLEKNDDLVGLEHLDTIFQAIQNRWALQMSYQSFKSSTAKHMVFHPWILKEYRNRWFVLGIINQKPTLLNFALDRIKSLAIDKETPYVKDDDFNAQQYYRDVIGVTVNHIPAHEITIWVNLENTPYVLSKPLHPSQRLIEKTEEGAIISLFVKPNFELEKEILAFGECMEVRSPRNLRERIALRMRHAAERYQNVD